MGLRKKLKFKKLDRNRLQLHRRNTVVTITRLEQAHDLTFQVGSSIAYHFTSTAYHFNTLRSRFGPSSGCRRHEYSASALSYIKIQEQQAGKFQKSRQSLGVIPRHQMGIPLLDARAAQRGIPLLDAETRHRGEFPCWTPRHNGICTDNRMCVESHIGFVTRKRVAGFIPVFSAPKS